jgi:hypothetical protein
MLEALDRAPWETPGVCVKCGNPLDMPITNNFCAACREAQLREEEYVDPETSEQSELYRPR